MDLKITRSKSFSKEEIDVTLAKEKILITSVMDQRKQIIWSKDYPKLNNSYSIKWFWNKKV